MEIQLRPAKRSDYPIIKEYDEFIGDRREDMERGELFVADLEKPAIGYIKKSSVYFFNKPFVVYLCVHPEFRRKGVANKLLEYAEKNTAWERLFISTESWNEPMHHLLKQRNYQKSGELLGLNEDDSLEIIYFKKIY